MSKRESPNEMMDDELANLVNSVPVPTQRGFLHHSVTPQFFRTGEGAPVAGSLEDRGATLVRQRPEDEPAPKIIAPMLQHELKRASDIPTLDENQPPVDIVSRLLPNNPAMMIDQTAPPPPVQAPVGSSPSQGRRWEPDPSLSIEAQLRQRSEFEKAHGPQTEQAATMAAPQLKRDLETRIQSDATMSESQLRTPPVNTFSAGSGISPWNQLLAPPEIGKQAEEVTPQALPDWVYELQNDELGVPRLSLLMTQLFGDEWVGWEPETIQQELQRAGVALPPVNMDKIMALKVLFNTDKFYTEPLVFQAIVAAMHSEPLTDLGWHEVPLHRQAAAVAIASMLRYPHEWSPDVCGYIAASAIRDGFMLLPPELGMAAFTFSNELARRVGDEAFHAETRIVAAMRDVKGGLDPNIDFEQLNQPDLIQCARLMRVAAHVAAMKEST